MIREQQNKMFNRDECLSQYRSYCQFYIKQREYVATMADTSVDDLKLINLLHDRLLTFGEWFETYYDYAKFPSEWGDIAYMKFGPINI